MLKNTQRLVGWEIISNAPNIQKGERTLSMFQGKKRCISQKYWAQSHLIYSLINSYRCCAWLELTYLSNAFSIYSSPLIPTANKNQYNLDGNGTKREWSSLATRSQMLPRCQPTATIMDWHDASIKLLLASPSGHWFSCTPPWEAGEPNMCWPGHRNPYRVSGGKHSQ